MRRGCALLFVVAFAALLAWPAGLRAQDAATPSPDRAAAAAKLFEVLFDNAFVALNAQGVELAWPGIEQALRAGNPMIDPATLSNLRSDFERLRLARLRELMKDIPTVYARHLTAEEMSDVAAFYRTKSGARMLQALPAIVPEAFALALPRLQRLNGEAHEQFLKNLRERGLIKGSPANGG
jgi:hypothetical protein